MPQRQKVTWAQLRVGVLVIVSLAVLAIGIFFISGQVGFFTRRYTLKTYFSSASDLHPGAEVRLAGIAVGNVSKVTISSFSDPDRAVEVDMSISRKFQKQIRSDSTATIETVGLLGESYIDISRGGQDQAILPPGGIVQGRQEPDIKQIVQNTNDVISNLRVLSAKLTDITGQVQQGHGTLGAMIYDQALYNKPNKTADSVQNIVADVQQGRGSLGKLLTDESLYQKATASVDRLNQIMDQVQHGNGSMAKFINDPALYDNLKQASAQATALMDNINAGKGTLGKLAVDPTLYNKMNETLGHVDVVATRIDQGEGTLGKLSTDPSLFNSLNQSAASLRDFLTEFRKNPRKYLTLHMHIF
jgi:phospholipid/cholesterol/gamma-HCH transport system substrate-binding protein